MFEIDLNKYFYTTRKYYSFFDAIVKEKEGLKRDKINGLGIVYSTYRANKLKENSPRDYINILLDYIEYSDVKLEEKNSYEILLSKIYYTVYYRQLSEIKMLLGELDKFIEINNYLKPVFVLFKMLYVINQSICIDEIIEEYKKELDYLYLFRKGDYFDGKLKLLNLLLLFHTEYDVDRNEIENLVYENDELSWIYNNVMASHYYRKGNDIKAYMYYNEAIKKYELDGNIERKLYTINNVSYLLNLEDMYVASLDKTTKVINYIYSQKNASWIENLTQHYLFSLFMLKRYEDIVSFYEIIILDYKKLSSISSIICLLAAYHTQKLDNAYRIIENKMNDKNFTIILKFIKSNKNYEILDEIENTPYIARIKIHLKNIK